MPKRNLRPKPNAADLFPIEKAIEDTGQLEVPDQEGRDVVAPAVPEMPVNLPEAPMKSEPAKGAKQSCSAFLTELFQSENPKRFRQMNQLIKDLSSRYSEDDLMNALRHYYKYSGIAPNIADWCIWDAYEKMAEAIENWREFERVKTRNAQVAKESNAPQTLVYK